VCSSDLAYRAEAIGDALFNALGIKNATIAYRLRELEDHIQREEAEAQRKAQRARERSIFDAATLAVEHRPGRPAPQRRGRVAKVSDASLLAEVRSKRHRSISDIARAVGLAAPTTWNRIDALVKAGKLGADEVPKPQNGGGRPRRKVT
jgi:DNA-binding Lrp family transcriptional regulator